MIISVILTAIVVRAIDFIISFAAQTAIPYLGFFPYTNILELTGLPRFLYSFANFDGVHYMIIARQGYQENEQAYFPLYPILINAASNLFSGVNSRHFFAGLFVSHVSFLGACVLFMQFLKSYFPKGKTAWWVLAFLCVYPTSFYFGAVYTESLFFLLLAGTLLFLQKKQYGLLIIFAYLAALTRLIGLFLVIPIFIQVFVQVFHEMQGKKKELSVESIWLAFLQTLKTVITSPLLLLALLAPALGFATYSLYLFVTYGDPLLFFNVQPSFGANRSTQLIILPQVLFRYIKIFITAAWNYQYFVAVVEFVMYLLVMGFLLWDTWYIWLNKWKNDIGIRLGLNLFSFVNMVLPTLTGTLSSTPRYGLFSLSMFLILAQIQNKWIKAAIALIFALAHIALFALFIQGYFVS